MRIRIHIRIHIHIASARIRRGGPRTLYTIPTPTRTAPPHTANEALLTEIQLWYSTPIYQAKAGARAAHMSAAALPAPREAELELELELERVRVRLRPHAAQSSL